MYTSFPASFFVPFAKTIQFIISCIIRYPTASQRQQLYTYQASTSTDTLIRTPYINAEQQLVTTTFCVVVFLIPVTLPSAYNIDGLFSYLASSSHPPILFSPPAQPTFQRGKCQKAVIHSFPTRGSNSVARNTVATARVILTN